MCFLLLISCLVLGMSPGSAQNTSAFQSEALSSRALLFNFNESSGRRLMPFLRHQRSLLYRMVRPVREYPVVTTLALLYVWDALTQTPSFWIRGASEIVAASLIPALPTPKNRLVRKPSRVTEPDAETLNRQARLELVALNRRWDAYHRLPGDALDRVEEIRRSAGIPLWPTDEPITKGRSQWLALNFDRLSSQFRTAHADRNIKELKRLNLLAQALLNERASILFTQAELFVRKNNTSAAMACLIGAARVLEQRGNEMFWERYRLQRSILLTTFNATTQFDEIAEIIEIEGWDIREKALGSVSIRQQRVRKIILHGVPITRLEWSTIVYQSIAEAYRSQIHTLNSLQNGFFDVIDHSAQMRHVERLLEGSFPSLDKALHHLPAILKWAERGHVEGKKYAEVELREALKALEARDVGRAVERLAAARLVLKTTRLEDIRRIERYVSQRAASILNQIRRERGWSDAVRDLRSRPPEMTTRQNYVIWLEKLQTLLTSPPYRYPPEGIKTAADRIGPTLLMLKKLEMRFRGTPDLRAAVKRNIEALREDLSFVGEKIMPSAESQARSPLLAAA